jgi:hypothetical protein
MEVAQELSNRVAVIARGRMAVIDSLDDLMAAHRTPGFEVVIQGAVPEALRQELARLGAHGFALEGTRTRFGLPEGDPDGLYRALEAVRAAGLGLVSAQQQEINLEAVYRRIVGEAAP